MIQVLPIRHDITESALQLRTHILNPRLNITLTLTVEGKKENIVSILEDHLLETISSLEWDSPESDKDFAFLTENYNRFIRNLEPQDLSNISVVVSLLKENVLTISAIGSATAYLVEGEDITQIVAPEHDRFDFHTLTSGEVSRNASIYIANRDVMEILGADMLYEFSEMSSSEFSETVKQMFQRELNLSFHLIRVAHSFKNLQKEPQKRGRGQLDLLRQNAKTVVSKVSEMPLWQKTKQRFEAIDLGQNEKQKYGFITAGAIVIFLLVFMLIRSFGSVIPGLSTDVYAQKVTEAQSLVEDSRKLFGNPTEFSANISRAESLLAEVRAAEKYLTDVTTIQGDIDAMKKEVYGIQTIDLSKKRPVVPFGDSGFSPVATFEVNNKLLLIGKTGLISAYVRDTELPKILSYPQNSTAVAAAINDSGVPFIISSENHLMTLRQDVVNNVSVSGQSSWELGGHIHSYVGNMYIVNSEQNQIYRYKPAANGFSQKTNILPQLSSAKILDIAVDGGYYILTADGKISRFLSTNSEGVKSLTLNKIPGAWDIDAMLPTQLVANNKLSYVYIRNGKKVWIFQPNSRSFSDINALTYVAQLEIQTTEEITDISVPRDGQIYISTDKNVYDQGFQITDGNFFLSN